MPFTQGEVVRSECLDGARRRIRQVARTSRSEIERPSGREVCCGSSGHRQPDALENCGLPPDLSVARRIDLRVSQFVSVRRGAAAS